jgi:O-antigen/teichoic acid export membrane protein
MARTRRRILIVSLLALLLVAVPQFVAPTWLPITWPIGALILAYEIQAWISLPGRWNQTANASPERLASDAGA